MLGGGRTRTPAGSLPMIATNAPCGGGLYTGAPGLGGTDPPAGGALRGGGAERLRMQQVALLAVSRAVVHPVRRRQHPWALAVQGPRAEAVQ